MATEDKSESHIRWDAAALRLSAALKTAEPSPVGLLGPSLFDEAGLSRLAEAMVSPVKQLQLQVEALSTSLSQIEAQADFTGVLQAVWEESAKALEGILEGLPLAEGERARLQHFAGQMVDFLHPENFLWSNRDALALSAQTRGESLLRGFEYLAEDYEEGRGEALPRLASGDAFKLGQELAATKGEVVARSDLYELIQYHPTTAKVHRQPLVIFPPWINKFYVLDLRAENSFVAWAVAQGFTVFMVSWVNPSAALAQKGLAQYVEEGILQAIAQVRQLCSARQVHALGYCVAGTGLAAALALEAARGHKSVASATFLTAMTDFAQQGSFAPYLTPDFRTAIRQEAAKKGVLLARYLSRTFAYLRARDLVYRPARRRYLMGEAPAAFDLLFWNGDGTNLTAAMADDLLEKLWTRNALTAGMFTVGGTRLDLSKIDMPTFSLACEADHIAPWQECYRSMQALGGDKTFVLAGAGHVMGVVNPPSRQKYGYQIGQNTHFPSAEWQGMRYDGSWWGAWASWLQAQSGGKRPARVVGLSLEPAPGRYVYGSSWPQDCDSAA